MAVQARRKVLTAMLAVWALPEDVLEQYLVLSKPMIQDSSADVTVGRAVLPKTSSQQLKQSPAKKVVAASQEMSRLIILSCPGNHPGTSTDHLQGCMWLSQLFLDWSQMRKSSFARTGLAMRAMEAVAAATALKEPVLLVGETGTGKTTLVQQIAGQVRPP